MMSLIIVPATCDKQRWTCLLRVWRALYMQKNSKVIGFYMRKNSEAAKFSFSAWSPHVYSFHIMASVFLPTAMALNKGKDKNVEDINI